MTATAKTVSPFIQGTSRLLGDRDRISVLTGRPVWGGSSATTIVTATTATDLASPRVVGPVRGAAPPEHLPGRSTAKDRAGVHAGGDPSLTRCGSAQDAGGNSAAGTDGQPVRTLSTIGLAACSTAPTEAAILPRLVDRLS